MNKRAWLFFAAWAALLAGCQDYSFEELPSSVIREKRWSQTIRISTAADILFLIDNSGSMVGEQLQLGQSFGAFIDKIQDSFGTDYQIAVVTTGVKSPMCPGCSEQGAVCPQCLSDPQSPQCCIANPSTDNCAECSNCMNIESGETGIFQSRLGKNLGTVISPNYQFTTNASCGQIIKHENNWCFFEATEQRGIAMVGTNGCGYEKGLEAFKLALDDQMKTASNPTSFLRENATLALIVVSDEEDCGKVGDTSEGLTAGGHVCYYAANGTDPDGNTNDPNGKQYRLTPVEDYYNFFRSVKGNRDGMVKFAAIVGVKDVEHPETTTIEFQMEGSAWDEVPACETPGCKAQCPAEGQPGYRSCMDGCEARPGTRYIKLAQLFGIGQDGFIDTICQNDFSETMDKLGTFVGCPHVFMLSEPILDPGLANILINDQTVPRYSCSVITDGQLKECTGTGDTSCSSGNCVPTWTYSPPTDPPAPNAPGGTITFATHYDPCDYFEPGDSVEIELVYVTP